MLDRVFIGGSTATLDTPSAATPPARGRRVRASRLDVLLRLNGHRPRSDAGFDLALTELDDEEGHRFLVRVGSGARALGPSKGPRPHPTSQRAPLLGGGAKRWNATSKSRRRRALARNLEHPRWAEVAERCLSCGNCTLVCPTCFCSDVRDATDLSGAVTRTGRWSSCFDVDHSYLHGGAVRPSTRRAIASG